MAPKEHSPPKILAVDIETAGDKAETPGVIFALGMVEVSPDKDIIATELVLNTVPTTREGWKAYFDSVDGQDVYERFWKPRLPMLDPYLTHEDTECMKFVSEREMAELVREAFDRNSGGYRLFDTVHFDPVFVSALLARHDLIPIRFKGTDYVGNNIKNVDDLIKGALMHARDSIKSPDDDQRALCLPCPRLQLLPLHRPSRDAWKIAANFHWLLAACGLVESKEPQGS